MLDDEERKVLTELVIELGENDHDEDLVSEIGAINRLLELDRWLSSPEFRRALVATIRGSATAVLEQRQTALAVPPLAKEIANNTAQTVLMLIEEPPTGEDGT